MTRTGDDRATVRRARVAANLLFLSFGMIIGTWTARIPAIKEGLGLTDAQLSIGLLAFAAGAITGMQVVGRLVDRHGSTKVMITAGVADGALLILPAYAVNLLTLIASLFVFGAMHGTLNIAMNANAVEVERALHKPIISSCHAVYSIGGFLGAAIGGLFARANLGPTLTFLVVAAVVAALATWTARWALHTRPVRDISDQSGSAPQRARATERLRGVLFLGVLAVAWSERVRQPTGARSIYGTISAAHPASRPPPTRRSRS